MEELTREGEPHLQQQRTISDPGAHLLARLGREEGRRRREESEEVRSRSATPGPSMGRVLMERHRKTPIPILCSRGAWMVHCVQDGV